MASDDEGEFIFYGTPLEREEDVSSNRKKKQALEQGRLRIATSLQEVYDENGRRRFHGAFTGGFSAGYYNTVGSKEGWVPQSFTSSRMKRAELAQQRPYDFMDDEEKAEQDATRLTTAFDFDTFHFTAAESARREAAQDLKKRPSAIPGFLPDEIIVPVSHSVGHELLRKMGWRHGRSIGRKYIAASSDALREGRKAMLAFAPCEQGESSRCEENTELIEEWTHDNTMAMERDSHMVFKSTPMYVINPKKDRYGFGFDPYKNAPEFRERRSTQETFSETRAPIGHHNATFKSSLFRPNVYKMEGGFGIGALEELGEEDEDIYAPGADIQTILSDEELQAPSFRSQPQLKAAKARPGVVPGFKPALHSVSKMELFPPPIVPQGFDPKHKFKESLESQKASLLSYEPCEVAPPDDVHLRKLIEGLATFVAKSGQKIEDFYMEKKSNDPMFAFLFKGNGHDYYIRKLWEERRKNGREETAGNKKEAALDSVQRGQLLGEIPLRGPSIVPAEDRARLQSALSDAFTRSTSQVEVPFSTTKPFSSDPGKQERFEQYLKEKCQGGLRQAAGRSSMTEWERAQENLEFEAYYQNLQSAEQAAKSMKAPGPGGLYHKELQAIMNDRFAPQMAHKGPEVHPQEKATKEYPIREERPWRPRSLVCKRFNLPDPFAGKPPPVPQPRSRTESFILLSGPQASLAKPSLMIENQRLLEPARMSAGSTHSADQGTTALAHESQDMQTIIEKPVDLYKAIFSDESDDEDDIEYGETAPANRSAEAAQAALNRLEAGDFLASIGKELGLNVPALDINQSRRDKDSVVNAEATHVVSSRFAVSETVGKVPQKLHYQELPYMSNATLTNVEVLSQGRGGSSEQRAAAASELIGHATPHDLQGGNTEKRFRSSGQMSSDQSTSTGSSEDSGRKKRNRKRRKDRRHSKSEKQKSDREHRRKKKHG